MNLPFPELDALPLGAHRLCALTDEGLARAAGVRIAFTGRAGGVSRGCFSSLNCASHVGDDPACVGRNREILLGAIGGGSEGRDDGGVGGGGEGSEPAEPAEPAESIDRNPIALIVPNQVHGTRIVEVSRREDAPAAAARAAEGADGIIVRCRNTAALLNFADCLPLILAAPSGAFAVVHAGWRGAVAGIAGDAVRALESAGDEPASLNAYIGPHIRACCFEVGSEVAQRFGDAFGPSVLPDEAHVDLARAVRIDLGRAGVPDGRIIDAEICTRCDSDAYFSYRAEGGRCGRNAAAAVRVSGADGCEE